jgi:hypothetical protein
MIVAMSGSAVVAVAALFGAVQETRPEPPIGSRIPAPIYQEESVDEATRAVALRVLDRMGDCVVKADPNGSMALLMTVPGSAESSRQLDLLRPRLPTCLTEAARGTDLYGTLKMQTNGNALKGAIAGSLYRLQFSARPPGSLPKPTSVSPIAPPSSNPKDRKLVETFGFGQCLADRDPEAVRRLVLSKAGSGDEQAALSQLTSQMPACVTVGTTIKMDRNSLRGLLAQSLYRWSITAAQATPGR